jgi:hypothetical protein
MKRIDDRMAWLLEAETPSIVYQARRDLRPPHSSTRELQQSKRRVLREGAVPAILARQSKGGRWKIDRGYYGPKFYSTHWSMLLLAELGVDGSDGRFRRGAEYMLDATQNQVEEGLENTSYEWSCLYGNILRYTMQAHLRNDTRAENLIRFCAQAMAEKPCACRINGDKPCAWGVVRTLWGLAAIPESARDAGTKKAIRLGIRFLLEEHHLAAADYPRHPKTKINPIWFKLSFPLFYHADILFTLRMLDELNALDQRGARKALDWLEEARRPDGRWKGTSPFRTRTWREMGAPAETDRWVTLQALRILRHAGRSA